MHYNFDTAAGPSCPRFRVRPSMWRETHTNLGACQDFLIILMPEARNSEAVVMEECLHAASASFGGFPFEAWEKAVRYDLKHIPQTPVAQSILQAYKLYHGKSNL